MFSRLTPYLRAWLNVLLVAALAVAGVLLAMPREAKFGYEYQVGQPWHYSPLIASFEFPILRSDEEIRLSRDSALQSFFPYFNAQEAIGKQQLKNFKADYAKGRFRGVPDSYVDYAASLLEEVYAAGVVDLESMNRLTAAETKGVRVISGRTATSRPLATIFSPRTAYEHLMHNGEYSREIMTRLDLHTYLVPNLIYDSIKTREGQEELLSGVSTRTGMVLAGERIIDRGERVTPRQYSILNSLKQESENRKADSKGLLYILLGQIGLVVMMVSVLIAYLYLFRKDLFRSPHAIYLLFSLLTLFSVLTSLFVTYRFFSVYIIPYAMMPIIIRVFMDTRTAFIAHIALVVICSVPLHSNYQFVITQIFSGITALYTIKELTSRAQILRTALIVTLSVMTFGLCYDLMQGSTFANIDRSWYWFISISGVALLFAYPLLYLIEQLFGFTSSVTLIEMSNINTPIIRRMAREAQGTFVHSMQVGNLAAEVAAKIGAKVQLVRTAALYHDIGKMLNPGYFTENQGAINPHDQLPEERSAEIIISHVTEGMRLAERYRIPKVIREFIVTHHGNSMVKYFYIQACNKKGAENVDKAAFTYPGRNPYTREQAILMMADAIEASSRSLKEYTEESITQLVDRIIDSQVSEGYFQECPITFRDIADAKVTFANSLKTIYHTRIAYPELHRPDTAARRRNDTHKGLFGNTWTWKK